MDWSFLKFGVKFMYLIQNITVAILLQITELLMEPVFICECNEHRVCFVVMYFLIPAFAFIVFACSLRQSDIFMDICKGCRENRGDPSDTDGCWQLFLSFCKNCSWKCGDNTAKGCFRNCMYSPFFLCCCKALYPAFCWVVILLIDGKYLACALYSKCNSTMTIVDTKDPEMVHGMMLSKVSGLAVVGGFVVLYLIYLCCDDYFQSHADRYKDMYISQLEKDRVKFARKYTKTCSERRRAWCEEELKKAVSQLRAVDGGDPGSDELDRNPSRAEPQPRATGGGDPEPDELDANKTVDIIKKCFYFNLKYESDGSPRRAEPQPGASGRGNSEPDELDRNPSRAEPQPRAADGGDPEPDELDAETTVDIIKKCIDFNLEYELDGSPDRVEPQPGASGRKDPEPDELDRNPSRAEPQQST